ncbi:hypothetical protein ABTH25_19750, partial [Acinetobacter baumannii]
MPDRVASDPESADAQYEELLQSVKKIFEKHSGTLFKTSADNLYELYLANIPDEERQSHTCGALEVASAPAWFCHPRSSMIGTLLQ